MKKKGAILLLLVTTVAFVLRIYKLDTNPVHLTPDEAALGYNAYSILSTGRDEYGKSFPIIFKSFGDFKPGLYVYTAIPFVSIFGLNELAVRLPSAIAGALSVLVIYSISSELSKSWKNSQVFALLSAFLLAVNPWHIQFSRGAWEANLSLFISLCAVLCYLKASYRTKYFYLSALLFGLTLWTYQGAKLSSLSLLICLLIFYPIKNRLKQFGISFLILAVVSLPVFISLQYGSGRLKVFSLFSYVRPIAQVNQIRSEETSSLNVYAPFFHSEIHNQLTIFMSHYLNYFSGRFLFFEGDWSNLRHSTPYHGVFYLIEVIFFVFGIYQAARSSNPIIKFLAIWLILSPLPAALSRDTIHAVRALPMTIPFLLIVAYGLAEITFHQKLKLILYIIPLLYFVSVTRFLDLYFVHTPILYGKYWYYGYKQVVTTLSPVQGTYQQIVFNQSYDQPYIYFLFYQRYDPQKWWPQAKLRENPNGDVGLVESLDNVVFRPLAWTGDKYLPNTLIVGDPLSMSPNVMEETDVTLVSQINYPASNEVAFRIFASKR